MIGKAVASIAYRVISDKTEIDKDITRMGCDSFGTAWNESLTFHNIFRFRLSKQNKILGMLTRKLTNRLDCMELNVTSGKIGGGFVIWHGYGTVIFCREIGENCSIYQNVTIGRGKEIDGTQIPVIGNDVNIYTGATVIGGISIGNNVDIAAGAVVLESVPDNCVVAGVPAKIVKKK